MDGNSTCAEELEVFISEIHNASAGLLFNSGYDANTSIFSSVPQPGDIIVYDEYIHASVYSGMRLSRSGKIVPFSHNSVTALKRTLEYEINSNPGVQCGTVNVFIAVETVYSMDGDVCPLTEIVELIESYPALSAYIIVDEAHAKGVLGTSLVSRLNLGKKNIYSSTHIWKGFGL